VIKLSLTPAVGSRFQPTGFPDLGAAEFSKPSSNGSGPIDALLVESAQSMANWAERTTWDEGSMEQVSALDGLPYIRVISPDGEILTSSRLEAHRLASAYVMDGSIDGEKGEQWFQNRFQLQKGKPLDHRHFVRAVCSLDPLSLIHGVFFARGNWPWQPKVARALTCFIEADGVRPAVSGGVKKDSVDISGENTNTGYGMVPHQRTEYTADSMTCYISIDHEQLQSYGLGDDGVELLESIIDFELASLFAGGLRLRTACDLTIDGDRSDISEPPAATERVRKAIAAAADLLGPVRDVQWSERSTKTKK
jgi:CRISPR-associated protein Csb1